MSLPGAVSALGAQVEAMLERVGQHRDRRTTEIRTSTAGQVEQILRSGRADARRSVHQAVVRERARMAQGLRQAQARAELESRQRAQRQTRTLLEEMWERIAAALEARWLAPQQRSAWIGAALAQAGALMSGRPWTLEHAAGVTAEDRQYAAAAARERGVDAIEWLLDPQLRAGLRVRAPGAYVDATAAGLLAHRADVEAAFLAEYAATASSAAPPSAPAAGGPPASGAPDDRP